MKLIKRRRKAIAILATAAVCLSTLFTGTASAATLTSLKLTPGDTTKATVNTYRIDLASASGAAKCIRVHFGASSAFAGLPASMALDSGSASVMQINGATTYTTTTSGDYVEGQNAGVTPTYLTVTNVLNPNAAGTYWAKVELWTGSATCAGGADDTGTLQFAIVENTVVSVTVDPSFTFSVANQPADCNTDVNYVTGAGTATAVALGTISGVTAKSGGQLLTVSGNAGGGYTVFARSTQSPAMRSAGHNWQNAAGTYPAGTTLDAAERFGYTFHDNNAAGTVDDTDPAASNYMPLSTSNQAVMDADNSSPTGTGCVSFVAQTDATTPAGSYQATIIYTAVPVF